MTSDQDKQREIAGLSRIEQKNTPPKFLQVGDTMVAVAHIVTVDSRENGSVEILITHDDE